MNARDRIVLRDPDAGSVAEILPGLGLNCYRFQAVVADRPLEVLWSEAGFAGGDKRPSGSGIPILFPFPGRIPGTVFHWSGRDYQLQPGDGRGNAIHGFVHTRPWRVLKVTAQSLTGEFQASIDDPTVLEQWPADFRITVQFQLLGNCLQIETTVVNSDERSLPCGLGLHPYFTTPLGGSERECRVRVPVTEQWPLADMLPAGPPRPWPAAAEMATGLPMTHMKMDDVFGGLQFDEDRICLAAIEDHDASRRVEIRFDDSLRYCVLYNPPHREAACIEPYSCVPACWSIDPSLESGRRVLEPGQHWKSRCWIEASILE